MIQLPVNGVDRSFGGEAEMDLLWYLRDMGGLTETKFRCGTALCGAWSVHNNGKAIRSCITRMNSVASIITTTMKGVGAGGFRPVQQAWMPQ